MSKEGHQHMWLDKLAIFLGTTKKVNRKFGLINRIVFPRINAAGWIPIWKNLITSVVKHPRSACSLQLTMLYKSSYLHYITLSCLMTKLCTDCNDSYISNCIVADGVVCCFR